MTGLWNLPPEKMKIIPELFEMRQRQTPSPQTETVFLRYGFQKQDGTENWVKLIPFVW